MSYGHTCLREVQRYAPHRLTVDLTATPDNRQVHRTNCLAHDVSRLSPLGPREYVYACPPWAIVPVLLRRQWV
jgi:hypothetical protein